MQDVIPYIRDSFNFLRNHILGITYLMLPFIVLFEGVFLMMPQVEEGQPATINLDLLILGLVVTPFYQASLILYMKSVLDGEYWSPMQCYMAAVKYWFSLISLYLLMGVAVVAGLFLLIVPGLVLFVRLAFAEFICVLENQFSQQAFASSLKETEKYQWLIVKGLLILFLLVRLPAMSIMSIFEQQQIDNVFLSVAGGAIYMVISTVFTIFLFRVYMLHKQASAPVEAEQKTPVENDSREGDDSDQS